METEIAQLKQEQAEILERDYRTLSRTYADNAKLYHDLHNHIEAIYQCLVQGDTEEAVKYCRELREPVQEIVQTIWTGDRAVDYLISSKISMAEQKGIRTEINIEFPRNANIRSVDLTAILGNLLDNALEAAETAEGRMRFLKLTIRRINAMLIIKAENGCGREPVSIKGEWQTGKKDAACHGWGLKSAETAAERYEGTVCTDYKNGVFRAAAQGFVFMENGDLSVPDGTKLKMEVPPELIPYCPYCHKPMSMNLRADETFVEDEGWHKAARRYEEFLRQHAGQHILYLELGVGGNTPGIIKYPFWRMTYQNPKAVYACVNLGEAFAPEEIAERSVCINGDIGEVLKQV